MNGKALLTAGLLAGALGGVAGTQPWLGRTAHFTKEADEVYGFPPPAQLHFAALGWDAAAADLLWSKLLVEYGTHWAEHREFREVPNYVDAILELEPDFPPVYQFVDTLLAYRPLQGTEDDVRKARSYLEKGTRERPDDSRLWLRYGEFIAFIAPSFLANEADRIAWRNDGAMAMGHAVELGADADRALSAASMLSRAGQAEMAVRYLERAYAFTQHPSMREVHEAIGQRLAVLAASHMRDKADAVARTIDERWRRELPFLTRDEYVLLGPFIANAQCVGFASAGDTACVRHWSDLHLDSAGDGP